MAGRPPCLTSAPEMTLSLEKPEKRPQDPGLPLLGDHRVFGTSGVGRAFPRHQALFARPNHSVFEEASKFTKEDFDKNPALFKAVEKSMQKWK